VVRAFYFALLQLGNFKTTGCLVGRPTCAPATTRLTPQQVGIAATYLQPQSLHWFPDLSQVSGSSFKQALQSSVRSIG